MNLRAVASVFAIAAAISACSSSSSGGGPASVAGGTTAGGGAPVTAPAGSATGGSSGDFCAKLTSANSKLGNLGQSASGGDLGAVKTAIDNELAAFQELGNGAPASVKPSIDDIVSVLQQAQGAFSNPSSPDITKLSALATKLPPDLTALGNYVRTNCTGS